MGIVDRAREQARLAAAQLREGADRAVEVPGDGEVPTIQREPSGPDLRPLASRALAEARSGLGRLVDHLDPALLADVIIRTTSIQERANEALRDKASPYRIDGIQITATVPPQISFSIGRLEPDGEPLTGAQLTAAAPPPLPPSSDASA